jgi:hypothetical protein
VARACPSRRSAAVAEAILDTLAENFLQKQKPADRERLERAIARIEESPRDWRDGERLVAPAWSKHSGSICDLTALPFGVWYRIRDNGAVVWVERISVVVL